MRRLFLFTFSLLALSLFGLGQNPDLRGTTVIVVRHAEKVDSSEDPDLSRTGRERATHLAWLLGESDVSGLFSSQFRRTRQTLAPLAQMLNLPVRTVDASKTGELVEAIIAEFAGKTVIVASHSDRVTEIIEALGGPSVGFLGESEYDNLFVVTLLGDSKSDVLRLKY